MLVAQVGSSKWRSKAPLSGPGIAHHGRACERSHDRLSSKHCIGQNELDKKIVTDFIILFNNLNNREPMESEIIDNLKDKIDTNTIKKILDQSRSLSVKINVEDSTYGINMV